MTREDHHTTARILAYTNLYLYFIKYRTFKKWEYKECDLAKLIVYPRDSHLNLNSRGLELSTTATKNVSSFARQVLTL